MAQAAVLTSTWARAWGFEQMPWARLGGIQRGSQQAAERSTLREAAAAEKASGWGCVEGQAMAATAGWVLVVMGWTAGRVGAGTAAVAAGLVAVNQLVMVAAAGTEGGAAG